MKTETLQIKYDAEKLSTLRLYMKKAQADFDGEIEKCIDKLCEKHVPKDVRELFEMRKQEQATRPARPPRSRPPAMAVSRNDRACRPKFAACDVLRAEVEKVYQTLCRAVLRRMSRAAQKTMGGDKIGSKMMRVKALMLLRAA